MSVALDELRQRYLRAQLAGNRREAVRIVLEDGFARGCSVTDLQTEVIRAAQQQIGILWQRNEVSIAQEHMATAISQLTLAALFERAAFRPRLEKSVVIACVEGELHDLPARFVADLLELEGFDVRFVGANVPHDHLVTLVQGTPPDVIGLSVTMSFNLGSARTAISRLRDAGFSKIFIGGHATTWSRGALVEAGATVCSGDPQELIASARSLAGVA